MPLADAGSEEAEDDATAAERPLTDLYQLTMLQGYLKQNMLETAVFEFFVRKLPANRNFLIAAGLEQVLDYLGNLQFNDDELAWLAASGRFDRQLPGCRTGSSLERQLPFITP